MISPQLAFFQSMKQLSFSCASSASAEVCTVLRQRSAVGSIDRGPEPAPLHLKSGAVSGATASSSATCQEQVVHLRVSLHCKACEREIRKHIYKMEGVTSFEVDLAKKKVTVVGKLTPLQVLRNISKVKNAQFWPSHPLAPLESS
ncbi:protein SODIUM POTASSIUM ROOT DEFECTIVE 2-like [Zingiber officinale]|uniref:HMA domain-containing protein n=1 Tax=Zingiber officinale TaxID=94328 RepID=A0A8J5I9I1_ZINOF|nr:protein SODIUM POTASSIUM ROOT DEFECTIVE 2-like [Zingiber officinale]KAG6538809.1 hypothetical protein ZIOFF_003939 [Zingiber officinale]